MNAKEIKPDIEEISLAFNPANRKKFFMQKEGGKEKMDELMKILEKEGSKEMLEFVKSLKVADDVGAAIQAAVKIMTAYKDRLPSNLMELMVKEVPETDIFVIAKDLTDEEKEKILKEFKAKIKKEVEAEAKKKADLKDSEQIKLLKDQIGTLEKSTAETKKLLKETKDALDKERDTRRLEEIKSFLKEKNVPGNLDEITKVVHSVEKMSPDVSKDIESILGKAGEAITAIGAFSEISTSREGDSNSAFAQLSAKVDEEMKKDEPPPINKAWEKVIKENPALYRLYIKERPAASMQ